MNKKLVLGILNIPRIFFNPNNNKSVYTLLKETGYFLKKNEIDEKAIIDSLEQNSKYIEDWLEWSANKRTDSGWYFKVGENKGNTIGYLDSEKGITRQKKYSDVKIACAKYIVLEIEGIVNS